MSGKINGFTLSYTAVGAILVWSGIKGASITGTFQSLLKGQAPTGSEPIGTPSLTGSYGSSGGSSSPAGSTPTGTAPATGGAATASETAWFTALLKALDAPVTSANLASLVGWASKEEPGWTGSDSGGSTNNPLNHGGSTNVPATSVLNVGPGIPRYATVSEGVQATVDYLENGDYGTIVMDLRAGDGITSNATSALSTWSGGGYDSV